MHISYNGPILLNHLTLTIFTFMFGYLSIDSLFFYYINNTYTIIVSLIAIGCFIGTIKTGIDLHNTRYKYE